MFNRQPKPLITCLMAILIFANALRSQTNNQYIPNVIPPSPNAASLMKFSDVPVSTYTGTADVTIPIYQIQAKGISLPVTLSYHTGGIRLTEEAGWVGLGWSLNAGGAISRTVMGKDDFISDAYFNSTAPQILCDMGNNGSYMPLSPYFYDFYCNYKVNLANGQTVDYWSVFDASPNPYYDLEPDIFNYNFAGHSGKFVITRDRSVLLQKQDNIRIQFEYSGNSFTITDDQGNIFYFADKEYSEPGGGGSQSISSWYLSQITTQEKDVITFNYTSDNTWTLVPSPKQESYRIGCQGTEGPFGSQDNGTLYQNITLSNIDYKTGQVQFSFDNTRSDLQNGKKLNAVKVYTKTGNTLSYVKEEDFFYSYFNPSLTPAYEYQRLKLDSVKESSGRYSLRPYSFAYNLAPSMNYSGKHSYAVDHWGFYNGITSNTTFVPAYTGYVALSGAYYQGMFSFDGANRGSDSIYMKAFSLLQVTYPTGGKTIFEYEPNFYDYYNSANGQQDFPQPEMVDTSITIVVSSRGTSSGTIDFTKIYPQVTYNNATLTITFRASTNGGCGAFRGTSGKIYFQMLTGNVSVDISSNTLSCPNNLPTCTATIPLTLNASSYAWNAYIDNTIGSNFMDITAILRWKELKVNHYNNPTLMASGLRIKSVTDLSSANVIAKKRAYDYSYAQNNALYSYGRLMAYPSYGRYETLVISPGGTPTVCHSFTRFGSSYTPLTSVTSGNIVGYDQVTESVIDPATGTDIGKTVYSYFNSPDTVLYYGGYRLPGVLNMGNSLNGSLLSKEEYINTGAGYNIASEVDNYYHTTNRIPYYNLKYVFPNVTGGGNSNGACGAPDSTVSTQMLVCFYPSVKSERVLLDSSVQYVYDQITPSNYIKTVTNNFYDNSLHYQVTRTSTFDSKGNKLVTKIRYPQDYITGTNTGNAILDTMIAHNMVSAVIEKTDSLYIASTGYVKGAQLSKYKILAQNVINLDKQYQLATNAPVTNFQPFVVSGNSTSQDSRYRQMVSFDTYDNIYNILQYTSTDQLPVSFVWDYNGQYPIAQIKKATSDQVAYTSFEADGKGNWNNYTGTITTVSTSLFPPTGNKYYNLTPSATLSKEVTTGKIYVVSYWSKNGAYSITGGSGASKTGKTINGWTYYEHTITASSTTLTISGTGAMDEVRMYPSDALMTTYTYNPSVGMISQCDVNNRISYFEYDLCGRLSLVRDQDWNIIKRYCYNYAGEPSSCDGFLYRNAQQQQSFTKNDCSPSYYIGSPVTYTVNANTYYSEISQADADQKALDDIAANGQNYANAHGTCSPPPDINVTYTNTAGDFIYVKFTNTQSGVISNFTLSPNVTTVTIIGTIKQGIYNVDFTSSSGTHVYKYRIYSYFMSNVNTASFSNVSLCSTCASITVNPYP